MNKDKTLYVKVDDVNQLLIELEKSVNKQKEKEFNPIEYIRSDAVVDFIGQLKYNIGFLNTECVEKVGVKQ